MYIDMVSVTVYGEQCSILFAESCLQEVQDMLDSQGITKIDYNFLYGVKRGLLKRME